MKWYEVPERINLCTHPKVVEGLIGAIAVFHIVFLGYMLSAPCVANTQLLFMHAFLVPFVVLHWAMKTDACAVSMTECYLFGLEERHSFVHRVVHPIFTAGNALEDNRPTYAVALAVWAATLLRVWQAGLMRHMLYELCLPFSLLWNNITS